MYVKTIPLSLGVNEKIAGSTLLASVMTLSVISYDRFTAIVLPKETRINRKGAKIVMVVTWFLGFALASPLFFYRAYKVGYNREISKF